MGNQEKVNKCPFDLKTGDIVALRPFGVGSSAPKLQNRVKIPYSRHADEGRVAAVEEGAVDHLQDEGEVLERQVWDGCTH